jgi:hypothetical protein
MPKSTKRFILSNEKLNSHGFRVITAGIDLTNFKKNPVMFWMHKDNSENGLPIGFWSDIQVNGTELSAIPNFDDSDELAMKIYNKVEHGTIRAAICALDPVKLDTDKANWLPGQKLPTMLKSKLMEASIVKRGSNPDAVTLNMNGSQSFIRLSAGTEINMLMAARSDTNQPTDEPQHSEQTKKILVNASLAGKITADQMGLFLKMPADKETVQALHYIIKSTPINQTGELDGKLHHSLIKQARRSYDDIYKNVSGGLNDLKKNATELYRAKVFEGTGQLPAIK